METVCKCVQSHQMYNIYPPLFNYRIMWAVAFLYIFSSLRVKTFVYGTRTTEALMFQLLQFRFHDHKRLDVQFIESYSVNSRNQSLNFSNAVVPQQINFIKNYHWKVNIFYSFCAIECIAQSLQGCIFIGKILIIFLN